MPGLAWPPAFSTLAPLFAKGMPCAPFDLPGWRFVRAKEGLYVGYWQEDARVKRVAYAVLGDAPPGASYRPVAGRDGQTYQVLWQRVP